MTTTCADFRKSFDATTGSWPESADYSNSYCNERYQAADKGGDCYPINYSEMFNCTDPNSWAYAGIFLCMGFSILGAGL